MYVDFVLNNQGYGEVGQALNDVRFDPGMLRPYFNDRGVPTVTVNTGRKVKDNKTGRMVPVHKAYPIQVLRERGLFSPTWNAVQLRRDDWKEIDAAVEGALRLKLQAWDDLAASNTYGGFDGMSVLTLEYDAISDFGEALQDMDGLADGRTDAPLALSRSIPLPITHSDFFFSERRIAVARRGGLPLDTSAADNGGRRIGEMIERQTIGTETGMTYGTRSTGAFPIDGSSKVYGYTNTPFRIIKTDLTVPTGSNQGAVLQDVIEMIDSAQALGFNGPYVLYHSTGYSIWLNSPFLATGATNYEGNLREQLMKLEGISRITRLNLLTSGYQLILVQLGDAQVARAVIGMPVTTVQWPSQAGMRQNLKVLTIMVPQIKGNYDGHTGVVHGTTF